MNVGILGLGIYLPETIRENNWWPRSIADKWMADKARAINSAAAMQSSMDKLPEELRVLLEAMQEFKDDPFEGSTKRHIMNEKETTAEMEIKAAKQALGKVGISANKIDFVLTQSTLPNMLGDPNACALHKALRLANNCYVQDTGGMCNAFLSQLNLAQALIKSGAGKYGLLVQSSGMSRFLDQEHPMSPLFGDGAAATVVGAVAEGEGILNIINYTNGALGTYLCNGIPGKHWYDEGRIRTYFLDPSKGAPMIMDAIKQSKLMLATMLKNTHLDKTAINFYAGHQGVKWFRSATQKAMAMEQAKTFDTFPLYASLVGANIPLVLYFAEQQKLLRNNDYITAFTPGTGVTAASAIIKWRG